MYVYWCLWIYGDFLLSRFPNVEGIDMQLLSQPEPFEEQSLPLNPKHLYSYPGTQQFRQPTSSAPALRPQVDFLCHHACS